MEINLADNTIRRVEAWVACSHGATADDVINSALDCFEQKTKPAAGVNGVDVEQTVERFRKYRGALAGVTIDDIVASRHLGLP
jgi:hypothetical protein